MLDSDSSIDSQVVDCATYMRTPYDNRPLLESSNSDDELDFHRKPKRSYCGNRMACQSLAISLFSLFIAWCVKIRTFSVGGFKTLRGNEEPCGSSTAGVWKLCRMWPFGFDILAAEKNWKLDFLETWRYLLPIINQEDTHKKILLAAVIKLILKITTACQPLVLNLYSVCALHLCQLQRQHVFLTTEAYNEMPTLRIEGHLNANALHV